VGGRVITASRHVPTPTPPPFHHQNRRKSTQAQLETISRTRNGFRVEQAPQRPAGAQDGGGAAARLRHPAAVLVEVYPSREGQPPEAAGPERNADRGRRRGVREGGPHATGMYACIPTCVIGPRLGRFSQPEASKYCLDTPISHLGDSGHGNIPSDEDVFHSSLVSNECSQRVQPSPPHQWFPSTAYPHCESRSASRPRPFAHCALPAIGCLPDHR